MHILFWTIYLFLCVMTITSPIFSIHPSIQMGSKFNFSKLNRNVYYLFIHTLIKMMNFNHIITGLKLFLVSKFTGGLDHDP